MRLHHTPASMLLEPTTRISGALGVTHVLVGGQSEGVSSIAMQKGSIGLSLNTLIISVPPMAAMFFQGTLGSFSPYSVFGGPGGSGRPGQNGQPPGAPGSGYIPHSWETQTSEGNNSVGNLNITRSATTSHINNDQMKTTPTPSRAP